MSDFGKGLATLGACVALIFIHPLGWIGMLVFATVFGFFK